MNEDPEIKQPKEKSDFNRFFKMIILRIRHLGNLASDTDVEATLKTITKSLEFRGANVWILAFATIVASIGLDVNSTAVIIGAMLISPLMGPINGVGLAIGISDSELLRKSLKNFCIMVVISLIASTLYFLISPLSDAQSELLARTKPTIFDVMIAFVGGLAGIVALSRKEPSFTVISGVAIATALMPPLCTAGFGLATGQMNFFIGAFYLFFINSVFIALATFIIVRFLGFPHKKYLDNARSKTVNRYITIFTVIVLTPSVFMAVDVIRETAFNNAAIRYINDIQESAIFDHVELINNKREYTRKERTITLSLVGQLLTESEINDLNHRLLNYGLTKTKLKIKQTDFVSNIESTEATLLENILDKRENQIAVKDSVIQSLQADILSLKNSNEVYVKIAEEIAVQYPSIVSVSISNMTYTETSTMETTTLPTLYLEWKNKPIAKERTQIINWLKVRLGAEEIKVIEN